MVELSGANSTFGEGAPSVVKKNFKFKKNFELKRVKQSSESFCYLGSVNGKECVFRIDTGSDVSILSRKFVFDIEKKNEGQGEFNLRYPTGEKVPIKSKIFVENFCSSGAIFKRIPSFYCGDF